MGNLLSRFFIFSYLLYLVIPAAHAVQLYQQPLDAAQSGIFSNQTGQIVADDFVLATDATITGFNWYGHYFDMDLPQTINAWDFTLGLYTDNAGVPGSELFLQTVTAQVIDTGTDVASGFFSGQSIYEFSYDNVPDISVSAGSTLWLSLSSEINLDFLQSWLWSTSLTEAGDINAFRNTNPDNATDWANHFGELAFQVNGDVSAVPLPPAALLFASGIISLSGAARRKKT